MNQFEMKQAAYQSALKSRALQVLIYLIDRANKEGTCFPAISTIGRELHISVSTVKRALHELTESGYVKKTSRFRDNKGQTSNLYTLYFGEDRVQGEQDSADESIDCTTKKDNQSEETNVVVDNSCEKNGEKFVPDNNEAIIFNGLSAPFFQNILETTILWTGEEVKFIPP